MYAKSTARNVGRRMRSFRRALIMEGLEQRLLMANDLDDNVSGSRSLGVLTTSPKIVDDNISPDTDVDMFGFSVSAGQVVDFDADTTINGPGGLGTFFRLFNSLGQLLAANDNGAAPGENTVGFDAYLRHTFAVGGNYYLGVSNANNIGYDPITGTGDRSGGSDATGSYRLTVQVLPIDTDDSTTEAPSLGAITTTPIVRSSTIAPDIDVDLFRFTVSTGQVVDFDIDTAANGPGGLGSYLRLFDAQGQPVAANNDAVAPGESTLGFDAYLRFTFNAGGTYYIGVSNANNIGYDPITGNGDSGGGLHSIGDYQLTIQALPVDNDDTLAEASSLGAISTTPITRNATITPDIDVDMYRFTVNAGQVVDFDIDTPLNGPGGLGGYLRLFNDQGQQLAFNDNAAAPGEGTVGFDPYFRFTFTTAGTYTIAVSNFTNVTYDPITGNGDTAGGLHSAGDYTLTIQSPGAATADPDDTLAEAPSLGAISTTPITRSTSITPDIDVDMFRFTVTAGQVVDFDIDTTANGPGGLGSYLRLFNAQGQQLAFNNDGIAPGESTLGFDAYLRHTFTTGGTYTIAVSNSNNTTYDPITGNGDTAGGANSIGDYQLIVQTPSLPATDGDDTLLEATFLGTVGTAPQTVSGIISPDVDVDMFRFNATAGQLVDFDVDTILNGPGGLGSYLRLFNSQGQQLASNDNGAAPGENTVGFDSYLRFFFTVSGTYYLGISNSNNTLYNAVDGTGDTAGGPNATGDYQITVQALPADSDDTLNEATSLGAIGSSPIVRSSTISPDLDVDLFRFTVTAGQVVDFDIDTSSNGPSGLSSYLRLFDIQGQQIAFNDDGVAPGESVLGFDAYLRFTFTAGGTYYVGVSNSTNIGYDPVTGTGDTAGGLHSVGDFQLTVQSPGGDNDDTLIEANVLGTITTAPVTRADAISPDTDVDMFRFSVNAGQVVDFDIDTPINGPGGLGAYLRLFNSQGQQLAFNDNAAAPGEGGVGFDPYLRFTFTAAGIYTIAVSNSNNITYDPVTGNGDIAGGQNSIGDYQLTVQTPGVAPNDPDDSLTEAVFLGAVSTSPLTSTGDISPDVDVDVFRFTVDAGQTVDFDIDTPLNGPGGLGSLLRLFNAVGQEIAVNDNAAAPGEGTVGFDAYLRFTFTTAGTYYVGISNSNNGLYDVITGAGDIAGGFNSTGTYQLSVQAVPVVPALTMSLSTTSISENGGQATGTMSRTGGDISQPITVTLATSDAGSATVPPSVIIAANQTSASFTITAVHSSTLGTRQVVISANAPGFAEAMRTLVVTDSDGSFHNAANPNDTNDDGFVSPIDALLVINYLNANGPGPTPSGSPPPYIDVNGDNFISAIDALLVINALNIRGPGGGESEDSAIAESLAPPIETLARSSFALASVRLNDGGLVKASNRKTATPDESLVVTRLDHATLMTNELIDIASVAEDEAWDESVDAFFAIEEAKDRLFAFIREA